MEGQRRRAAAQRGLLAGRLRKPQAGVHRRALPGGDRVLRQPPQCARDLRRPATLRSRPRRSRLRGRRGELRDPDADADHSLDFWDSVATRFRDNHAVLFHAYDEPHKISWECALDGCATDADGSEGEPVFGPYQAVGHQAIVDTIRATGATQPIIVSGIDFAGDLSRWAEQEPFDPLSSIAVGFNDFDYADNLGREKATCARSRTASRSSWAASATPIATPTTRSG